METMKYSASIIIATLLGVFILPWWVTPLMVLAVSYLMGSSPGKSFGLAFSISGTIWMLLAIIKDYIAMGKIADVTGQILLGMPPFAIYLVTGFTIAMVCGLMAVAGIQIRTALKPDLIN